MAVWAQLFTDPKQPVKLDTRDLFGKMAQVNSDAADRFLEVTVLQERDSVRPPPPSPLPRLTRGRGAIC